MSLLEIHCSQPDCHWSGAPDDAGSHECPTPAEAPLVADIPTAGADGGPPLLATKDELERWLVDNGSYTGTGEPADAATEQADRQYAQLVAAERAAATEPEPPVAEPEIPPAPPEPEPLVETPTPAHADAPWEVAVAEQIRARDDARQIRWAIVDEDAAEILAGHAIKAAAETDLVQWLHGGREATIHRISELLKAADAAADQSDEEPEPAIAPEPELEADEGPTAIEQLEQAAADAGGTLEVETSEVIEHPEPEPEPAPAPEPEPEPITAEARAAVEALLDIPPADEAPLFDPQDDDAPATDPEPEPEPATPTDQTAPPLFDPADYDKPGLQIPKVDGHAIDRIALDFTGGVMLDRSDPANVELYNRVHGRGTLELWIEAKWGGTAGKPATNRDGETDIIVGRKTLRVETIRIVEADQLGALEGLELVRAATRAAAARGIPADQIETACIETLAAE